MEIKFKHTFNVPDLFSSQDVTLNFFNSITTFIGPNGSGKSQVLRELKKILKPFAMQNHDRKVRLITAGRLAKIESYRANHDGARANNYDDAQYGAKHLRDYRHESEGAVGDFHTLDIRPDILIKVSERLSALFKKNIYLEWDSGNLKVNFSDLDGNVYSSAREASGLLHLVSILTAIYDDEIGVLLLDEPEISLHPQLQSFLFQEIRKIAGHPNNKSKKMIIIATHSTEFFNLTKPEDLINIVYFRNSNEIPMQIDPDNQVLNNKKIKELLTRLGYSHKAAFFSSKPLLVEGPSDQLICNALNQHLDIYLEASSTQVVPVIGKGEFPVVVKLMRIIGKNPVILADLDSFVDNITFTNIFSENISLKNELEVKGHEDLGKFSNSVFNSFVKMIEENWGDIESKAVLHSYFVNKNDENKAKKRAGMAVLLNMSDEELDALNNSSNWRGIKKRIIALFDILELAGCFILRKGTIENYYVSNSNNQNKITSAIDEIECVFSTPKEKCEELYPEIIRALNFATSNNEINEVKIISQYLSSIISPALMTLDEDTTDEILKTNARKIIGDISSIFKLSKFDNSGEPFIRVELISNILEIEGFPIDFPLKCNPNEKIKSELNI